jgi:hypothetical protein
MTGHAIVPAACIIGKARVIFGNRRVLLALLLLAGGPLSASGAAGAASAPAPSLHHEQVGMVQDSRDTLASAISEIEECVERRYVALQMLCAMSADSSGQGAPEQSEALAELLAAEPWTFDESRRPDLAFARESLRDVLAYMDEAEIAIRLALDSGLPGLAISIFLEHYDPACAELFILCDAAREAAAIPEQ